MFNACWLTYLVEIVITVEKYEKCFPAVRKAIIDTVHAIENTHGSEVHLARLCRAKKVILAESCPRIGTSSVRTAKSFKIRL